jgi:cell division protein FtsL
MGGYLVSSDGGGDNATAGMVTIRVPAARFEEARAEIRKLGVRVESEKTDAQDATRQYVDQDANLRNLHAEEAQYLAILKQANTVKDLLAVSEKLSEVRGQIERQQAEFNALSQQIETVALTISLRTEAEAQTFGLNWRPGYQLKVALRDGLESLATYATAMMTILFYLPATLLWVGTILIGTLIGWRSVRWVGRRWFGWKEAVVQG